MKYHNPVLLQATIDLLDIQPGCLYVDATLGGGGHAIRMIDNGGRVLGLDQDSDAISACSTLYKQQIESENLKLVQSNFTHLEEVVNMNNWRPVSGMLFDLGISSHQVDTAGRGFSFQKPAPLDMRMDRRTEVTAADIVNTWPEKSLVGIFKQFGELSNANILAKKICQNRPFSSTTDLASVLGTDSRQVFQALRIAVNDELTSIQVALDQAIHCIAPKAKIAVISFHSLEDRIVKQTFLAWSKQNLGQIITDTPVVASEEEIEENSRSKSAKLRVFQHI